ncbi:13905_t:CDS:2 [Acaulospora morrowiae]|uniref:13905_t:CDS:1 n=1 Tax=Acaulospora morrowiae TaxID=94023 RepID=A0A9N8ZWQ7_9GLOM|nr:13905_t:CDS:2 [Acaulospora morrowiae]
MNNYKKDDDDFSAPQLQEHDEQTQKLVSPTDETSSPSLQSYHVEDFQDLYADKTRKYIFSDSFTCPVPLPCKDDDCDSDDEDLWTSSNFSKQLINDIDVDTDLEESQDACHPDLTKETSSPNQPRLEHKWRLLLYPHGNRKDVNTHISLYLAPTQSLHERQNSLETRVAKWRFEIFRINEEHDDQMMGLTKLDCHQDVIQEKFTFASSEPNWGIVKFCDLSNIFTNFNPQGLEVPPIPTEKVNLVFRVHFLDENSHFTTTDNSIDNININILLKLGPSLKNFFDNKKFSDVEFVFEDTDEKLRASKTILASRSNYFNTMFNGHWVESNTNAIHIKDVSYEIFKIIIYFLYTGHIDKNLDFEVLKNVYYEADMREIPELSKLISFLLVNLVNKNNWDEILLMGWLTENSQLLEQGLMYVKGHWLELKDTDKMMELMKSGDTQWIEDLKSCSDGAIIP